VIRSSTKPVLRRRQRGAALLALVLLVVLSLVTFMLAGLQNEHRPQKREQEAQVRLAQARDALISHATLEWCKDPQASESPQWRLPCPAAPAADGTASNACSSASLQTGRLPWRTLGTSALRDEAGECFWYQREPNQAFPPPTANTVVARVIAANAALPTQVRPGAQNDVCGDHPTIANYVEPAGDPARNDAVLEVTYAALQLAENACPTP
jgi:hypothetical protein